MGKKKTLEFYNKIAVSKRGKCISKEYVSSQDSLLWQCSEGHVWKAIPNSIQKGSWCYRCLGHTKIDLSYCNKIAIEWGGKCLSTEYIDRDQKIDWECSEGHKWSVAIGGIQQGSWCPTCRGGVKKDLDSCKNTAHKKGGKCLSTEYANCKTKMLWECNKGHTWVATFDSISSHSWCPMCNKNEKSIRQSKRHSIEKMQKLAEKYYGKCLSDKYINSKTALEWECRFGHRWIARPINIITGHWCSQCAGSWGEKICRAYFEIIFNEKFYKSRPKWLKNPKTSKPLELDGYCEKLGIAFEYNGRQHYIVDGRINKSEIDLNNIKERDKEKIELCKKHNIVLIIIPELVRYINVEDLESFILKELSKNGINQVIRKSLDIDVYSYR